MVITMIEEYRRHTVTRTMEGSEILELQLREKHGVSKSISDGDLEGTAKRASSIECKEVTTAFAGASKRIGDGDLEGTSVFEVERTFP